MHHPGESDEEEDSGVDRLGGLGPGAIAALGAGVFALSLAAMVAVNLIGAALGDGLASPDSVLSVEGVSFEVPQPAIAVLPRADAPAWRLHSAAFAAPADRPLLALVILDDGAQSGAVARALGWSAPLSFAVAADFDLSPHRVAQVRRAGREALALLPFGYGPDLEADPNVLRQGLTDGELLRRLGWHLARAGEGIVGAVDRHGGAILRDSETLGVVGVGLTAGGMLMIDSRDDPDSLLAPRLRAAGVPVGRGMARIGRGDMQDVALAALAEAEAHAAMWGTAIVLVEAGEDTMDALDLWMRTREEAVALAPVSHVVRRLRRSPPRAVN